MFERLKLSSAWSGLKAAVTWTNALTGQAWNGSAWTTWSAANLVAGATSPATFDADGYATFGAPPAGVAAVAYVAEAYAVAGSALTTSDLLNTPIGRSPPLANATTIIVTTEPPVTAIG